MWPIAQLRTESYPTSDPTTFIKGSPQPFWRRKWQPTAVFLPGKSLDRGASGLQSMGSQRVVHDLAPEHLVFLWCNVNPRVLPLEFNEVYLETNLVTPENT